MQDSQVEINITLRTKNKTIKCRWEAMTQIHQDLPSRQWDTTLVYRMKNKSKKLTRVGLKSALLYALAGAKLGSIPDKGKINF